MALFETMLVLVLASIGLLQVSRRLSIPYPTMLAAAGVCVAMVPWVPVVAIDPYLALALFIAPALFDSGYDLALRDMKIYWRPLIAMAVGAVIATTAAVAWVGVTFAGLPWPAAIALGAIVAPPDAAAAAAMLSQFSLPRRTVIVLQGESLLNDAVSLLIFSAAVALVSESSTLLAQIPSLALAAPGGMALGFILAKAYMLVGPRLAGTLSGILFEFAATFATWILAERLHVSAILSVVVFAMTLARDIPQSQPAIDRIRSYSVWAATIFLLNVLAFLLMGLQAREIIISGLSGSNLSDALTFSGLVLGVTVSVRLILVMTYNRIHNSLWSLGITSEQPPTFSQGIVVSWCGMRGLVTLAVALALPKQFPGHDLIILSAFSVVIGTLVIQGLTLKPLIEFLRFTTDRSMEDDLSKTRADLIDLAIAQLGRRTDEAAIWVRQTFEKERQLSLAGSIPQDVGAEHRLRRSSIASMRDALLDLRRAGAVSDETFHALEQEFDLAELAVTPRHKLEIFEG